MELWDAYKIDGQPANCDLVRGEPIPDGLYHLVCEILVLHSDGEYLLMQRDLNKIGYPGMFEATAGGSALKGESPNIAALRELREETGIVAFDLTLFNITHSNNSIFHTYLCITDCDKASITLQEEETISYRWVSKDELIEFMHSSNCIPSQRDRLMPYLQTII